MPSQEWTQTEKDFLSETQKTNKNRKKTTINHKWLNQLKFEYPNLIVLRFIKFVNDAQNIN